METYSEIGNANLKYPCTFFIVYAKLAQMTFFNIKRFSKSRKFTIRVLDMM